MLGKLFETIFDHLVLGTSRKNPVYQSALAAMHLTLDDTSEGLGKYAPPEHKKTLAWQIMKEVREVVTAADPVIVNREKLADYVFKLANFQVLVIPSTADDEEDVTGLRGKPGITGELKAHLKEIAEKDEEVKKLVENLDHPTTEDIIGACQYYCWNGGLMTNVFNSTRIALGDCNPVSENDWYRPFFAAMCASAEYHYRMLIGLPNVFSRDGQAVIRPL